MAAAAAEAEVAPQELDHTIWVGNLPSWLVRSGAQQPPPRNATAGML